MNAKAFAFGALIGTLRGEGAVKSIELTVLDNVGASMGRVVRIIIS